MTAEVLQQWFDIVHDILLEYGIHSEDMYNMDETEFAISSTQAGRVLINVRIHIKFQAQPRCQEWVTVIECICANGSVIPPLVIFK